MSDKKSKTAKQDRRLEWFCRGLCRRWRELCQLLHGQRLQADRLDQEASLLAKRVPSRRRCEQCSLCNNEVLTVWQIPEYFISIRNSSSRISSRTIGVNLKGAFGSSTTKASVSIFVVADMAARIADKRDKWLWLQLASCISSCKGNAATQTYCCEQGADDLYSSASPEHETDQG